MLTAVWHAAYSVVKRVDSKFEKRPPISSLMKITWRQPRGDIDDKRSFGSFTLTIRLTFLIFYWDGFHSWHKIEALSTANIPGKFELVSAFRLVLHSMSFLYFEWRQRWCMISNRQNPCWVYLAFSTFFLPSQSSIKHPIDITFLSAKRWQNSLLTLRFDWILATISQCWDLVSTISLLYDSHADHEGVWQT